MAMRKQLPYLITLALIAVTAQAQQNSTTLTPQEIEALKTVAQKNQQSQLTPEQQAALQKFLEQQNQQKAQDQQQKTQDQGQKAQLKPCKNLPSSTDRKGKATPWGKLRGTIFDKTGIDMNDTLNSNCIQTKPQQSVQSIPETPAQTAKH